MSEDKAREELNRANRASRILEDDLFVDAVEAVKDHLWGEFAQSKLSDDDTRRNARIGVDMLDRILQSLRKHIETGKMAKVELAEIEKKGLFKR